MPDIRYVCLSDMHFGADNSLMTCMKAGSAGGDPTQASPVVISLVGCLRELISKNESPKKPKLILNGDILELALTTDNRAAMAFERFLELIMLPGQEPLFDSTIFYLPGNHDHHLWETAREAQYSHYISGIKKGVYLDNPWHATSSFIEERAPLPAVFLNTLAKRVRGTDDVTFATAYPNFGLLRDDKQRCVLFHHGHFTESIYLMMSTLNTMIFPDRKVPSQVWDIETENFAWIDFFWSTMGRSGEVGEDVELVYDKMLDPGAFDKVLQNLAGSLVERFKMLFWNRWIGRRALFWALEKTAGQYAAQERLQPAGPLSDEGQQGLKLYVEGPLREQIKIERKDTVPPEVTFVFGHTHKPFEQVIESDRYRNPLEVYNCGGWVVDAPQPTPVTGGAAILVDENLDVASLRLYNEATNPNDYAVKVQAATSGSNPFCQRIASLMDPSRGIWKEFSSEAAKAVSICRKNLRYHIRRRV
ncbi:MAG: metallophosphoesterase [Acidobacteriia bacterium]|nr:metallophosphoesterase [Terriglobia bacterium]